MWSTTRSGGPGPQVVALKTLRNEVLRSRIRMSRFAAECDFGCSLVNTPTSFGRTRSRSSTVGRMSYSS